METINSITTAAQKAIWGEQNTTQEPVSGEQGAGTVNEPFDKGNEESKATSGTTGTGATGTSATGTGATTETTGPKTGNTAPSSGVDTTTNRDGPSNATGSDEAGDPTTGQQTQQKQQGADRPAEAPASGDKDKVQMPHSDAEREKLVEKGEFPHDPNDHSGEPLHMHDGSEKKEEKKDEVSEGKQDRSASVAQEGGAPMGQQTGTGEKYVKSTGLAAEGGDFDATNPGAGAEATRLQEEKGIHKDKGGDNKVSSDNTADDSSEKTKTSKLAKLKEKLHIKH